MKILIDVGGSGVKIKRYLQGRLQPATQRFKPTTFDEFCDAISQVAKEGKKSAVEGIAISLAGEYDYANEEVTRCCSYPFLVGKLRNRLASRFKCRVRIVNDGDAHVLALKNSYKERHLDLGSAVNFALGTGVAFGILDQKGKLLHSCRGYNWEVGNWQCDSRAPNKDLWWALGSNGLSDLEDRLGRPQAYRTFGARLCYFLGHNFVPVFRPKVIGLSGGIVTGHISDIKAGFEDECNARGFRGEWGSLRDIVINWSWDEDFVMLGLEKLIKRILIGRLSDYLRGVIGRLSDYIFTRLSELKREPVDDAPFGSPGEGEDWVTRIKLADGSTIVLDRTECVANNLDIMEDHVDKSYSNELIVKLLRLRRASGSFTEEAAIEEFNSPWGDIEAWAAWRILCRRCGGENEARELVFPKHEGGTTA